MEQAVLKQSEDALREMVQAFRNIGMPDAVVAMMLREVADDIDPPRILDARMH